MLTMEAGGGPGRAPTTLNELRVVPQDQTVQGGTTVEFVTLEKSLAHETRTLRHRTVGCGESCTTGCTMVL